MKAEANPKVSSSIQIKERITPVESLGNGYGIIKSHKA
jgi:hypothetical protein